MRNGKSVLILVMLGSMNLGCETLTAALAGPQIKPTPPAKPVLETLVKTEEGGICMGREDSAELLLYIKNLETAYE